MKLSISDETMSAHVKDLLGEGDFPVICLDADLGPTDVHYSGIVTFIGQEQTRRLVACVNALAHVSTELLETGSTENMAQRAANAERQRDQLLAALLALYDRDTPDNRANARAAIAAVKGGA